ncbi:hypothetical protein C8250_041180 [Streptomyces sp. So13.3]|uniref:hypothetical protein n=1 Tax=Streptomyces TaxID=1883 RepID=UPI001106071F|nr:MULTISPECIES: hypothetical protein [Streptomyces]MCZ4098459.1 hypothetical protein [Streptomyces sp. H39-C1]QNA77376.1 hypothetical protein C8250_041180 [Streptomyces sp. So13.3]
MKILKGPTSRRRAFVLGILVMIASLLQAPAASATDPADAPPGYGGPFNSCPGQTWKNVTLRNGTTELGYLQIWYHGTYKGGTYCARAGEGIPGAHHMEIVVRRGDWQTSWYDSGTYNDYAGFIDVYGAATKCVHFFGRVTVNGVNYERTWLTPECL